MSAKIQVGISTGLVGLMIFAIIIGGYLITENQNTMNNFIERWDKRIQISNVINNETQQKIANIETDILNNLTSHRIITNETNDQVLNLQNDTQTLIKSFNNTNEQERTKAVNEIINAINNNTKLLEEFLGVNSSGGISSID